MICNPNNIKVPFPVPVHISLYFHVLFMLLRYSNVYFILISKYFLGRLFLLRNYKLNSVADIAHCGCKIFLLFRLLEIFIIIIIIQEFIYCPLCEPKGALR